MTRTLPPPRFGHLRAMTDGTGLIQHATFAQPARQHGHCLDDNARALIVCLLHHRLFRSQTLMPQLQTYFAFTERAFCARTGEFYNLLDGAGSWFGCGGDAHGRALWALGLAAAVGPRQESRNAARTLLLRALPAARRLEHPRSQAFALFGLTDAMRLGWLHPAMLEAVTVLSTKLHRRFREHASVEWPWFEETLTYANAVLPHALLVSAASLDNRAMEADAYDALRWLTCVQRSTHGDCFSFVGNKGFMTRGCERAPFDQQPIEAMTMVRACLAAARHDGGTEWLGAAWQSYAWFRGCNDGMVRMVDDASGACFDGLCPDGPNLNRGAESTLAWLIALLSMREALTVAESPARHGSTVPCGAVVP